MTKDAPHLLHAAPIRISCGDAITLLTGNMCVSLDRLYALYNELTGDHLYAHQLPRAFHAVLPHARKAFPSLDKWLRDRPTITRENWQEIVAEAEGRFGDDFYLTPLPEWARVNPIIEAMQMMTPAPGGKA